jgi:hypothetical protein
MLDSANDHGLSTYYLKGHEEADCSYTVHGEDTRCGARQIEQPFGNGQLSAARQTRRALKSSARPT